MPGPVCARAPSVSPLGDGGHRTRRLPMRAEYAQTAAEEVLTYSGSDPRVARNAGCGILLSRLGCTISPKESKPSQFQCKASRFGAGGEASIPCCAPRPPALPRRCGPLVAGRWGCWPEQQPEPLQRAQQPPSVFVLYDEDCL